ncbi:MAG TPA: glycosyltransferase family 2 protein [Nitrospira sp.]|nr:glycosyltransferase family 2 protein [Nitrospira sp.]
MITDPRSYEGDVPSAYWVVIPAYNEAATVRDVVARTRRHCHNVIVVDDGSSDDTSAVLTGLDVTVLRNEENLGKAGSLWRGFQHAMARGGVGVVTLDADGQHAPEEIPLLVAASFANRDALVIGARRKDQRKHSFWRYAANRIADFWIGWAAGRSIEDTQSGFRLYPLSFLRHLHVPHGKSRSFVFESEALIEAGRTGIRISTVGVGAAARGGPSPSHFRPVLDIAKITVMVAGKLFMKGLYPSGLFRMLYEGVSGGRSEGNIVGAKRPGPRQSTRERW